MKQAQRILEVQDVFTKQEFVSVEELCARFESSKSSIRRDLIELERKGVLRRVHGGALSLQTSDDIMDFGNLSTSCHEEKTRIGKAAAALVEDGQTVILSGGSTVAEVARCLSERPIQIVTNSIPVAQVFWDSKQAEVILTGGYLYPRLGVQLGPICEKMLHSVSADILIMGIRGITEAGISDSNSLIVESLRAMIKAVPKVVIVADHTKFGRDALIHVASLNEVHQIVSDKELPLDFQRLLEEHNIVYILA
ncbi:MAG TPA: DeoR/GlpR family DNA-binding transcription regulator [Acidobacteriaceae bacterium]